MACIQHAVARRTTSQATRLMAAPAPPLARLRMHRSDGCDLRCGSTNVWDLAGRCPLRGKEEKNSPCHSLARGVRDRQHVRRQLQAITLDLRVKIAFRP